MHTKGKTNVPRAAPLRRRECNSPRASPAMGSARAPLRSRTALPTSQERGRISSLGATDGATSSRPQQQRRESKSYASTYTHIRHSHPHSEKRKHEQTNTRTHTDANSTTRSSTDDQEDTAQAKRETTTWRKVGISPKFNCSAWRKRQTPRFRGCAKARRDGQLV